MVTSPVSERINSIASAQFNRASAPVKGDTVKVIRGRKVPIGTVGVVFWVGQTAGYGYSRATQTRVGIKTAEGVTHFVSAEYVEVSADDIYARMPAWSKIVGDAHMPVEGQPDTRTKEQAERDLAHWIAVNPGTMDYLSDFVRANAGEDAARKRLAAIEQEASDKTYLDPWAGTLVPNTLKQHAYHDECTLTYVLGGEFDEVRVKRILSGARTRGMYLGSSAGATDYTLVSNEGNVITVMRSVYRGE